MLLINMKNFQNPREKIHTWIKSENIEALLLESAKLHGHVCPFLTLGVRGSVVAAKNLDVVNRGMEDILAVIETNNCFSDGVQYVTGCTFGNNSLIYRDYGKTAFTFLRRGAEGIRISVKPDFGDYLEDSYPSYSELFEKVVAERNGNKKDREKLMKYAIQISREIIEVDFNEIFRMENADPEIPDYAPIFENRICSSCGENVMASRVLENEDKNLCISCANADFYELNGDGIEKKEVQ